MQYFVAKRPTTSCCLGETRSELAAKTHELHNSCVVFGEKRSSCFVGGGIIIL